MSNSNSEFLNNIDNLGEFIEINDAPDREVLSDELVCECNCIPLSEVLAFLRTENNWDSLAKRTGLGSGCGKCFNDKKHWQSKVERYLK